MKRAIILSLLALLVGAPAFAGSTIVLDDPVIGTGNMKAWGMASKDVRGGAEFFNVRADASLKDGSTLVFAIKRKDVIGKSEWIDVCKAAILLGTATCSLNSKQHVSPAFPIAGLSEVMVKYRGRAILKGHF